MKENFILFIKQKRKQVFFTSLLLLILALSSKGAVTYSRYVIQRTNTQVATPVNYCFTSNYLTTGGASYTIYSGSVSIEVSNTDGITTTNESISYSISGTASDGSKTISGGTATTDSYLLSGTSGDSKTVTVTVSSPYTETISATFIFLDPDSSSFYEITDNGYYITLALYTGSSIGEITVTYGNNLVPDNTNSLMTTWTSGTSGTLSELIPNAYYTMTFFEISDETYDAGQTLITGNSLVIIAED